MKETRRAKSALENNKAARVLFYGNHMTLESSFLHSLSLVCRDPLLSRTCVSSDFPASSTSCFRRDRSRKSEKSELSKSS